MAGSYAAHGIRVNALAPALVNTPMAARAAADPATVATQIDGAFENREVQTLSQDEQKFQRDFLGGMEAILGGLDYASMALLGIIGLIVANTIAMGVRERVGEYGVLRALGLHVVRGSTSKRGVAGLLELIRGAAREGADVAFAVDGPRGPYGVPKPGASASAKRLGGELVPLGVAASREHVLARTWDRFRIVWPFARVAVVLGAPIELDATPERVAEAIAQAEAEARALLA
jgi:lysophospholipid acyltransferase (LPLAT)-like uncharacterized protein